MGNEKGGNMLEVYKQLKKAKIPNVVTVGRGKKITGGLKTNEDCIIVGVTKKKPMLNLLLKGQHPVPSIVNGVKTDVQEVHQIKLLDVDRTGKFRPAMPGISIGHKNITAGTFGLVVHKKGEWFILSCNHVLANCNNAQIGDDIMQPGPYDIKPEMGDCKMATLSEFVWMNKIGLDPSSCPFARATVAVLNSIAAIFHRQTRLRAVIFQDDIEFNTVDCALARPDHDADIDSSILEIGAVTGTAEPKVGMKVHKSGRTSSVTYGSVTQLDVTANVMVGDTEFALFTDQVAFDSIGEPGDSGSAILTEDNKVVVLLFAGSDTITLGNKFSNIVEELGLEVLF